MAINEQAVKQLNELLKSVNLDDVTAESTGFADLEEGYYLCEVDKAELTTSKKGTTQVAITYTVIENGWKESEASTGTTFIYDRLKSGKGRKIFKYYPLKDESSIQRFANDMLKFEGKPGESLVPKQAFLSAEDISDALDILQSARIVVNVSYAKDKDGNVLVDENNRKNIFYNPISWARADRIQLPLK